MKERNDNKEQEKNQQDQQDWYNIALIFAKSIGFMLNEKEGIVIHLEHGMKSPDGKSKKVVLVNYDGMIQFEPYGGDLPDGSFLTAVLDDTEENLDEEEVDDRITLDDLLPEE